MGYLNKLGMAWGIWLALLAAPSLPSGLTTAALKREPSTRLRAGSAVRVRLVFGDPDSEAVRIRGVEEGIGEVESSRVVYEQPVTVSLRM